MVLTSGQILASGIVPAGAAPALRDTTYDATIGEIIVCGNVITESSYILKSRDVAWVVSSEEFNLPSNITGLATLKTSWGHEGVFALNVGIVDPGWKGPVATALVNFGRDPVTITKGKSFLRVAFLTNDPVSAPNPPPYPGRVQYVKNIVDKSRAFSDTFLNMTQLADQIGKDVFKLPTWAYRATIVATFLTLLSIFGPITYSIWSNLAQDKATILGVERRLQTAEEQLKNTTATLQQVTIKQELLSKEANSTDARSDDHE